MIQYQISGVFIGNESTWCEFIKFDPISILVYNSTEFYSAFIIDILMFEVANTMQTKIF